MVFGYKLISASYSKPPRSPVHLVVQRGLQQQVTAAKEVFVDESLLVSHSHAMADTEGRDELHDLLIAAGRVEEVDYDTDVPLGEDVEHLRAVCQEALDHLQHI